jgi:hypothetical protein
MSPLQLLVLVYQTEDETDWAGGSFLIYINTHQANLLVHRAIQTGCSVADLPALGGIDVYSDSARFGFANFSTGCSLSRQSAWNVQQ